MRRLLLAALAATLLSPICEAQTLWRQTGYSIQGYYGTSFTPAEDSLAYFYSGNHAGLPTWDPFKSLFAVTEEQFPHDSSVSFFYDNSSLKWNRTETSIQTIDTNDRITLRTKLVSNNGGISYVNYEKDEYIYDASGNLAQYKYWWWINNQWRNSIRETYSYSGGNLATRLTETYNAINSTWNIINKYTYTYTGGKLSEELFEEWLGGNWVQRDRSWFGYNANNLLEYRVNAVWNNSNFVWDTANRHVYSYDANNNVLGDTTQKWNGFPTFTWRNDQRFIYEYDANNNPVKMEFHGYDLIPTPGWGKRQRSNYTYNADTLLSANERMYWNTTTSAWEYTINSERYNYYYQSFTYTPPIVNVPCVIAPDNNLTLYPNPAITQLRVNATWNKAQPFTVAILDMNGRVLKQWSEAVTKTYSSSIPVIDMPAGNYTIVLNNGEQKISKRFSVLK